MPVQKVRASNKQGTWKHLRTKRSGHARLVLSMIAAQPLRPAICFGLTNASKALLRWSDGLIYEGERYLYVTRGIGTSSVPLRWGVPPGYAVFDVTGD